MLLPAAIRYKAELLMAEEPEIASEVGELISAFVEVISGLEQANLQENHAEDDGVLVHAKYMHDVVFPAMGEVRTVADSWRRRSPTISGRCRSTQDPLHQVGCCLWGSAARWPPTTPGWAATTWVAGSAPPAS